MPASRQKFDGWCWEIPWQSLPCDSVLCQRFQFHVAYVSLLHSSTLLTQHTREVPWYPAPSTAPSTVVTHSRDQTHYEKSMSYILHFLVPWTQNITLGLDPITLSSPQRIAPLLNVILLLGRLLTLFFSCLFYVLTLLFNMYRLILSLLPCCN